MSNEQSSSVSCTPNLQIDKLCQQFEEAWQTGQSPRVEDYLEKVELQHRTALFVKLLNEECKFRAAQNEPLDIGEFSNCENNCFQNTIAMCGCAGNRLSAMQVTFV